MVTVKKLLTIPRLKNVEVVAGNVGLERSVGHVTVMEVPDVVRWLKGDDFLLTSLYAIKDDVDRQCRLLTELSLTSCACVAVKTGQYVKEIDRRLSTAADRLGIPLLRIPYDLPYIDIIINVMNYIFEERNPRVVLEKYIQDVLFEAYSDEEMMIRRGGVLGLFVDRHLYAAMSLCFGGEIIPDASETETLQKTGIAVAQFAAGQPGLHNCIAVVSREDCTIFLDSDDEATLARHIPCIEREAKARLSYSLPRRRVCIGYGSADSGLEGIRRTYSRALRAIRTGQVFFPHRDSWNYDDMEVYCLIEETIRNRKVDLFRRLFQETENEEIFETLDTFFEFDKDIDKIAAKLHVHKNTVKYRLNRLKELTGLDIRKFHDRLRLYMAVIDGRIHGRHENKRKTPSTGFRREAEAENNGKQKEIHNHSFI